MFIDNTLYTTRPAQQRLEKEMRCYDLLEALSLRVHPNTPSRLNRSLFPVKRVENSRARKSCPAVFINQNVYRDKHTCVNSAFLKVS